MERDLLKKALAKRKAEDKELMNKKLKTHQESEIAEKVTNEALEFEDEFSLLEQSIAEEEAQKSAERTILDQAIEKEKEHFNIHPDLDSLEELDRQLKDTQEERSEKKIRDKLKKLHEKRSQIVNINTAVATNGLEKKRRRVVRPFGDSDSE